MMPITYLDSELDAQISLTLADVIVKNQCPISKIDGPR